MKTGITSKDGREVRVGDYVRIGRDEGRVIKGTGGFMIEGLGTYLVNYPYKPEIIERASPLKIMLGITFTALGLIGIAYWLLKETLLIIN
jgi:hypothetical protein